MHRLDISNAFLHGDLHKEVFMVPPLGYTSDIQKCASCIDLYMVSNKLQGSIMPSLHITYCKWGLNSHGLTILYLQSMIILQM